MGKASRRRLVKRHARPKEVRDGGPGFIEAIETAQRERKQGFDEKFGQKVKIEIKDGQMHVGLAKPGEKV